MPNTHAKAPALPPVNMEPLQRLVALVHELELAAGDGYAETLSAPDDATVRLANIRIAVKAIANHPLADWDTDPLIIRRWSDLGEG